MRFLAALLVLLPLLAACGQTGDLYLPDQAPKKTPEQQPGKSDSDESDKKKEQAPEQTPPPP